MKKYLILATLAGLSACDQMPPAAAHDCQSLNLKPGSAAYTDCMNRMTPEERALHNEQTTP
ncbi:MAG: hypothetical protein WDN72_04750 [Alphaproteobacteria bacterium]